jgi:hypothetical protein
MIITWLQESDVKSTLVLLERCAPFYQSGELTGECLTYPRPCVRVPPECITHNAVFTILHFLTDDKFMAPENVGFEILQQKNSFVKGDCWLKVLGTKVKYLIQCMSCLRYAKLTTCIGQRCMEHKCFKMSQSTNFHLIKSVV